MTDALVAEAKAAPPDAPGLPWWKSKKFLIVTAGSLSLETTATVALFMGKADFAGWSTFSLTLFGLAMSLYGLANVAEKFALARAQK